MATFGGEGLSVNDVFSIVDGACYVSKDLGRNRIHVYSPDDAELAERKGQMNWVGRINKAMEENRIHALPPGDCTAAKGTVMGGRHYEVLLRMRDEDGRHDLARWRLFPAAERYNLMPTIDFWVIRTAFEHYATHCRYKESGCNLAINLSGATLGDEKLLPYIREQLQRFR